MPFTATRPADPALLGAAGLGEDPDSPACWPSFLPTSLSSPIPCPSFPPNVHPVLGPAALKPQTLGTLCPLSSSSESSGFPTWNPHSFTFYGASLPRPQAAFSRVIWVSCPPGPVRQGEEPLGHARNLGEASRLVLLLPLSLRFHLTHAQSHHLGASARCARIPRPIPSRPLLNPHASFPNALHALVASRLGPLTTARLPTPQTPPVWSVRSPPPRRHPGSEVPQHPAQPLVPAGKRTLVRLRRTRCIPHVGTEGAAGDSLEARARLRQKGGR